MGRRVVVVAAAAATASFEFREVVAEEKLGRHKERPLKKSFPVADHGER